MTVGRLITLLEQYDENAEVKLMTQEGWPFENRLSGICAREDIERAREDIERDGDDSSLREDQNPTDVFLIEGSQLGYGSKDAWNSIQR